MWRKKHQWDCDGFLSCVKSKGKGKSSYIAYGRATVQKEVDIFKIDSYADVYIHIFLSWLTDRESFFSKDATKHLLNKIDDYAPDIVYSHNIHGQQLEYGINLVWR